MRRATGSASRQKAGSADMCVAIPLQITEISGNVGLCERDGVRRAVHLDFIKDPKPGDYVLVHAGFAIERVKEDDAREAIALANEIEEELRH